MLMTRRLSALSFLLAVLCISISAQPDIGRLGPPAGKVAPDFSGVDQFGRRHTLQSVLGAEGAMIVFFRSADW